MSPTAPATEALPPPPARLPSRPVRRTFWVLVLVAAVGIPVWLRLRHAPPDAAHAANRAVAVAGVERRDLERVVQVPAEFRPFEEVDLHSKVAGFLETITVDVGDAVAAGQLLATLEIPELRDDLARAEALERRAEAEVQRAESAATEAHATHTRISAVDRAQPKLVAQQELDTALAHDQQAASALSAAKQQVAVAHAETAKLATTAKYARITAPFSGVITRRAADPGALIPAGISGSSQSAPILRVSQTDRLRLAFPVSMSHVSRIEVGTPVEIRIQNREQPIAGKVARFARRIESSTRTMEVEVDVPNPDLKLIPGMYATVAIQLERRPKALSLPIQAVTREPSPSVMLLGKDHVLEERPVKLGLETPTRIEILSGLREGDLVLVGGRGDSKPGDTVEPRTAVGTED